ncbi:unnamed protein product, partial [Musa acuminata subsp. burmannicoides]
MPFSSSGFFTIGMMGIAPVAEQLLEGSSQKGKVIVMECILPVVPEVTPRDQYIYQLDICMLAYTIGGKERTKQEFQALAMDAGFTGFKALPVFAAHASWNSP